MCIAHSIQKGTEDVLYPKSPGQAVKEGITDESDNDDEEYDQDGSYLERVKRIRKIWKIFRESPRENGEFLQFEVRKELNKELK